MVNMRSISTHYWMELMDRIDDAVSLFMQRLYSMTDEQVEALKSSGGMDHIVCKAGCSWCCHERVCVVPAEAVAVIDGINRLPIEMKRKVAKQWKKWKEIMPQQLLNVKTRENFFDIVFRSATARRKLVSLDKKRAKMMFGRSIKNKCPCPLLVDGKCSIYQYRPMNCRTWFSDSADGCKNRYTVKHETYRAQDERFLPAIKECLGEALMNEEAPLVTMVERLLEDDELELLFSEEGL